MSGNTVNGPGSNPQTPPVQPKPKQKPPEELKKNYKAEYKDVAGKDGKISEDSFVQHAKDLGLKEKDKGALHELYAKYAGQDGPSGKHGQLDESEFDKLMASTGAKPRLEPYKVKPGDGFIHIAEQLGHGHDWQALAKANGLTADSVIQPGQTLKIPEHWQPDAVDVKKTPDATPGNQGSGNPADVKKSEAAINKASIDGVAPINADAHKQAQQADHTTLKDAQSALKDVPKDDPQHKALQDKVDNLQKAYDAKYPKPDEARIKDKAIQDGINDNIKNLDHENPDPAAVKDIADRLQQNGDPTSLARAAALRTLVSPEAKGMSGDTKKSLINALQDNDNTYSDLQDALGSCDHSPAALKTIAQVAQAAKDGDHPDGCYKMADTLRMAAKPGVSDEVRKQVTQAFDDNDDAADFNRGLGAANSKADYAALQSLADFHGSNDDYFKAQGAVLKNVVDNYDLYSKSPKWDEFKGHIRDAINDGDNTSSELRSAVESILTDKNMHDPATGKALNDLINARLTNYDDGDTKALRDHLKSLIDSKGINPSGSDLDKVLKDGI